MVAVQGPGKFSVTQIWRKRSISLLAEVPSAFYQGEIAEAIVGVISEARRMHVPDDLASHTSTWEEPISVNYRGFRVYECPPNGQGITALIALNILEGFDLSSLASLSSERLHLMIEASAPCLCRFALVCR